MTEELISQQAERLNKLIDAWSQRLAQDFKGVAAAVEINRLENLEWKKDGKSWGLWFCSHLAGAVLLRDTPIRIRVKAAEQIPALLTQLKANQEQLIEDLERACKALENFLEKL